MNRLFFILMMFCSFAVGQESYVSINPSQPKIGDQITITYNAGAAKAQLKTASDMECQTLVDRGDFDEFLIETPLKKDGSVWRGTFTLQDPGARLLLFRFVSGEKTDDDSANVWNTLVYGSDGKAVKGANYMLGWLLANGNLYGFRHSMDMAAARSVLAKETEIYPETWKPRLVLWDRALKENDNEETRATIHKELDAVYASTKNVDEAYWDLIPWYEKLEDSSSAARLTQEVNTKFPQGKSACLLRYRAIMKNKDFAKRAEMLEKLLSDFPDIADKQKENYLVNLSSAYIADSNYDKAAEILSRLKHPTASYYNGLSWPLIEKGKQLDKAVAWAKQGVDLAVNADPSAKPGYYTRQEWEEQSKELLYMILDTYGYGLLQLQKYDEAEKVYRESYQVSKGEDVDVDARYVEALVRNKHFEDAMTIGRQCIEDLHESPKLLDLMKEAYAQKEGSEKGFDALPGDKQKSFDGILADANRVKTEKLRKKILESRTNTPSMDFTVNDLQGMPVVLSSLKGKVVILDFWATWCGPCRASFPYLQKVYEKYQKNPHVAFLAVDSWERMKDIPATVANAKKFMNDNKYTFPVVLDDKVAERYNVTGIPTKFIIDKNGDIAFTTIGFDGPGMEDELTQQIEILLGEIVGSLE